MYIYTVVDWHNLPYFTVQSKTNNLNIHMVWFNHFCRCQASDSTTLDARIPAYKLQGARANQSDLVSTETKIEKSAGINRWMMLIWIRLRNISELKDATKNSRTPSIPFEILAATAPSKGANHLSCSRLSLTFQWGACHSKWMTMDREPTMYFQSALCFDFFLILGFAFDALSGPLKSFVIVSVNDLIERNRWILRTFRWRSTWHCFKFLCMKSERLPGPMCVLLGTLLCQNSAFHPSKESIRICWVHRLRLSHDRCRAIPVAEQEGFLCDCEVKQCRIPSCL